MSRVQLSPGSFQVADRRGLWSWVPRVVEVLCGCGWYITYICICTGATYV